jgi:hypothetical protein
MFTDWLLGRQVQKVKTVEDKLTELIRQHDQLIDIVWKLQTTYAGDLEEHKVRIEILEKKLASKKPSPKKKHKRKK